ncbi:MAG: glutamate 5-kinase [Gammaproteobacteria bacterium]|nr:glutamate 5-kinase [Gammaproteobacteria bacterium]
MAARKKQKQRWVVKLGSGILTNSRGGVDLAQIKHLAAQVKTLKAEGVDVILVSSGAVSAGMTVLGLDERPQERTALQACASIGQPVLMKSYEKEFSKAGLHSAQILLTYWDLDSRQLYKNTQATIEHLLELGTCVPIVNENDALSFEEIEMLNRFGDNDRLSAHVALLAKANALIILSSIDGLYENPDATGELIPFVKKIDSSIQASAGTTQSQRSVGGMISKLETARMMMDAGIPMILANGRRKQVLTDLFAGVEIGTLFAKKKWSRKL